MEMGSAAGIKSMLFASTSSSCKCQFLSSDRQEYINHCGLSLGLIVFYCVRLHTYVYQNLPALFVMYLSYHLHYSYSVLWVAY